MKNEIWIVEWLIAQDRTWMMSAHTSKEAARSKMGLLISQWPACQHVTAKEWKP